MSSMTPATVFLKQGDTGPPITATLIDQFGVVANLTGASVYFVATNSFLGNIINAPATIVNAVAGQVSYSWQTSDTQYNTGTFSVQWRVTFSSGAQESYPQGFYDTLQIDPNLTSGYPPTVPNLNSSPLFNTIWSSSSASAPSHLQGNNGDFWYSIPTGYFYGPKAGGTWPTGYQINLTGTSLSSFSPPTANLNMAGYSFNNLYTLTVAPTSLTQTALTANAPTSTTADIADFQINGTTTFKVNASGNPALSSGSQLDVTNGASSPVLGPASTPYAVVWHSTSGTNPAIGNGTLTASYFKWGRMVTVFISLNTGTTTTYGSNTWTFSLPFTPVTTTSLHASNLYPGAAAAYDSGGNTYVGMASVFASSAYTIPIFTLPYLANAQTTNAGFGCGDQNTGAFPNTWTASTANQQLSLTFTYESTT